LAPEDVAAPSANAIKTDSGLAMKVLRKGSGSEHPGGDDCVVVNFEAWKREGTFFSTSGLAGESTVQCLATALIGISEAMKHMVVGERRRIWIPAALTFPNTARPALPIQDEAPPKVDLTFDIELVGIKKAPQRPDNLKVPPQTAFKTPGGVTLNVLKPGTGTLHPTTNSRVKLHYSGWTTDGKLFESTITSEHPGVFLVGTVLPGWREALPYMVAGEKARIWIPASLAYGSHPVERAVPAGDLVYDIELLSID
jgi:peptidylprolyl isomerase